MMKITLAPALMRRYLSCNRGATAIEYALIVALIALGMIAGLRLMAGGSTSLWSDVSTRAINAMSGN
jgi:pilus assembly protein Flp/PilA